MKKMNIKNFRKPYILIPTIILSILFLIAAIGSWAVFTPFCSEKGNSYIYIDNNDNADSVYQKLRPNAASVKILTFRLLCHFYDYQDKVKSGKYNIGNGNCNGRFRKRSLLSGKFFRITGFGRSRCANQNPD